MDTKTGIDFTERVRRGVDKLDEWNPAWPSMIDPARLDVSDPWVCVVSQTAGRYADGDYRKTDYALGRYSNGLQALGIDPEMSHYYGFSIPTWEFGQAEFVICEDTGRTEVSIVGAYAQLTDTWREAISARLSVVQTTD